jgi:hypothetical protein
MTRTTKNKTKAEKSKQSTVAVQNRGGRPTIFVQAVRDRIIDFVRAGNYAESAASAAGISRSLFFKKRRAGVQLRDQIEAGELTMPTADELVLVEFVDALERAEAEAEVRDIMLIGKAGERDWKAAAWRRSRMNKVRWGDSNRVDMNANVAVTEVKSSDEVRAAMLAALGLNEDGEDVAQVPRGTPDE